MAAMTSATGPRARVNEVPRIRFAALTIEVMIDQTFIAAAAARMKPARPPT